MKKSRYVLKSLSLCNKVLSYPAYLSLSGRQLLESCTRSFSSFFVPLSLSLSLSLSLCLSLCLFCTVSVQLELCLKTDTFSACWVILVSNSGRGIMIFNLTSECDPLPPPRSPPLSFTFLVFVVVSPEGWMKKKDCTYFVTLVNKQNHLFVRSFVPLSLSLCFLLAYTHRGPKLFLLSSKEPLYYSSALLQFAWVQGRRATSKVTATSGGRLTNRYAWVPGRPTRRACLGVNLPLRVPPCKHYPEEVTELKMAAHISSATLPPETITSKKSDFSGQDKPFTQI